MLRLLVLACLLPWGCASAPVADTSAPPERPTAAMPEAPAGLAGPEILWDTWGVPHITAADDEALMYAFGWAQMHSHGDLLLSLYARARGRGAEIEGESAFANDQLVHTLGIPARAEAWLDELPAASRARLDAFVDGLNAYAEAHPDHLGAATSTVLPATSADVLAHQQLAVSVTFVAGEALGSAQRWQEAGSNGWAIAPSRSASGNALLLSNPHLPWSGLYTWYEAQLTAPGVDAYGVSLVGLPTLAIAFNDHLGWTLTVNTIDAADLYELPLADGGYRLDGQTRAFETSSVDIGVQQDDGTIETRAVSLRRAEHGPVVGQREGAALAIRIAGLDRPDMMGQAWDMMAATDLVSFEAALARLQIPMFNVVYADRAGHILYLFNGTIPVRESGGWSDWAGVVEGERSASIWTEVHPYQDLPRVLDPATGWVQNANDPPWTSTVPMTLDPDAFPASFAPRGMAFRPQRSARMLTEDDAITFDELRAYKHSTRSEVADRVLADLVAAARSQGGDAARAADVLEAWDRQTNADSRGAVLFETWMRAMGQGLFAEGWDPARALSTPRGLRDADAAGHALAAAAAQVAETYGRADVAWGDARRIEVADRDLPANGGPGQLGIFRVVWPQDIDGDAALEVVGGDSYVALVEFSDPVRAEVLLAYGNASQPGSPHRGDQLGLFADQKLRPAWRTRAEIEANLARREALSPR